MKDFNTNSNEVGLKLNIDKTKTLAIGQQRREIKIHIDEKLIEQKEDFEYLGYKLSSKGDQCIAVNHRIGKGWEAFGKLKSVLTSKNVNIDTKRSLYQTYILSCVTYGMECVSWTENLLNKMEVFQNHILRFMAGKTLNDRIPCNDLRHKFGITPICDFIKSRVVKLQQITNSIEKGVSKICFQGMVEGRRSRGRPKRRWRDNAKIRSTDETLIK